VQATTSAPKSQTRIHVERTLGSRTVLITGEIALGGKDVEQLAVSDPPLFAAQALHASLVAHGITVDGDAHATERASTLPDGFTMQSHEIVLDLPGPGEPPHNLSEVCNDGCGVTLAQRTSPPLAQDVLYTLKESQNLHAEQLLRRLGRVYGREASDAQGARVVRQFLVNAGLDGNDFVFYDGSGLSDHDLVTPRATAQLLAYASRQTWFPAWKASLPIGGVDGTLASRFKDSPLKGHIFAKTGTLGESRGLSGYVDCASGRQVIFSVYVDNHAPGGAADRTAMDKIIEAITASY
jgi:D-alanyl-D-alanine carboxypeptidase/D-alanyl-D-alanine-endopeptidase (penicillin-binding protein 4)